jgi:hypothetical protein
MLRALIAVLVVLGLSIAALAVGHSSSEGAHHATASSTAQPHILSPATGDEAAAAAYFALAAGEAGELAGICLMAMLCGAVLLLVLRLVLTPRAVPTPRSPRGSPRVLEAAVALLPRPVRLVELSISRT